MNNSYLSKGRRIFKISPKNEEQYKEKKKFRFLFWGRIFFLNYFFCLSYFVYALFLKGHGHQGIFSLVKGTLCGNCKFLL